MRQAGVCACLIVRCLYLVVELQRKLNVPRRLGAGNLPHRGPKAHVWRVQLDMVEGIDEVSSKLQSEPLGHLEVLLDAQVYVGEVRRSQSRELRGAIAECPDGWIGEVIIIVEPLDATSSWEVCLVDRRIRD